VVGNLMALKGDPLGFLTGLAREHGDAATFRVGPQETLLLSDPALIEQVLVRHRAATVKDPVTAGLSELLGQGLLTAEGDTWRRNRRLIAPSFQPRHLAALGEAMVETTERHLEGVGDGRRDVQEDMMALTLDIAVRTLFGSTLEGDAARVGPLVEELMAGFSQRTHTWRRLVPEWVPTPGKRMVARNREALHAILLGIVQRRRAEGGGGDDLLGRLLAARDDAGRGMGDDQLRDEMLTLFLAGHETTALALSYALWLLAEHPDVQARARAEVQAVCGAARPAAADCRRLPYVDAIFQEAMRLYPPAWLIGRAAAEDIEVGDIAVPAGATILMSPWLVHRDPRWWSDPLEFRPARWLAPAERPRFAYFPFGGGQRICVGNHFARMEGVLVLAAWLQALTLSPVEGFEMTLAPSVTLRPAAGAPLNVRRLRPRRAVA